MTALPRNGFRLIADYGGIFDLVRRTSVRGARQAMLDAIDLALMHGLTPTVYQWTPARGQNSSALSGLSTEKSALPISA